MRASKSQKAVWGQGKRTKHRLGPGQMSREPVGKLEPKEEGRDPKGPYTQKAQSQKVSKKLPNDNSQKRASTQKARFKKPQTKSPPKQKAQFPQPQAL